MQPRRIKISWFNFACTVALCLIPVCLYIGGFFDEIDKGMCLKSHKEPYQWTQQIWVGNISCGKDCYVPLYNYVTHNSIRDVCDEWEFPQRRNK